MQLELCSIQEQTDEDKKAGRARIVMTASSIHNRGKWNRRGITWLEQYVNNNIKSAIGAPFVVSFIDDKKSIPSGHGTLSYDEDGNCQFLDSDTVGSIGKAWIDEIDIDGILSKKLFFEGSIYIQRYPNFYKWLKNEVNVGKIKGSVEINGKGDSKHIVYEDGGNGKDSDGNWIIGRVPTVFDYTGLAILLPEVVTEADPGSEIIELNTVTNKATDNKSDDIEVKNKEELNMASNVKDPVVELNEKIVELNNTINELNICIKEKDAEINKHKEELNTCNTKQEELNSLLVDANKTVEANKAELNSLTEEIEPLRKMKAISEKATAQAEVDSYFKTIKKENGFTEIELNSLQKDYVEKCDLPGLKAKETELCVNKFKEMKKVERIASELNSTDNDSTSELFFSTKQEIVETNSAEIGAELFK